MWIVGVIILVASLTFAGWQHVANPSKQAVWDAMLANNFATSGVTRVVTQNSDGLAVTQYTQLNFGQQPTAHALTIFTQGKGKIITEEVSTPQADFVRYRAIAATRKTADGKPVDTSGVVGKWAKLGSDSTLASGSGGLFDQTVLGVLPIANLEPAERHTLLSYITSNEVFHFDTSKVAVVSEHGRKAYRYDVSVVPPAYIALMQQFGKLVGAKQFADLNPADYAGSSQVSIRVTVDVRSRQLVRVQQTDSGQDESYTAFGVAAPVAVPKATLTADELQRQITALQ